jgi:DNA-binding HxlR family transcriptional regulator
MSLAPYNPTDPNCPSRQVLNMIADTWTVLVIHALSQGTKRFGELQREVGGVSQKMLTQTLRQLERDGIVVRQVFPVVPPHTEYTLTPLGETLIDAVRGLFDWAVQHMPDIENARRDFKGGAVS